MSAPVPPHHIPMWVVPEIAWSPSWTLDRGTRSRETSLTDAIWLSWQIYGQSSLTFMYQVQMMLCMDSRHFHPDKGTTPRLSVIFSGCYTTKGNSGWSTSIVPHLSLARAQICPSTDEYLPRWRTWHFKGSPSRNMLFPFLLYGPGSRVRTRSSVCAEVVNLKLPVPEPIA